MFLGMFLGDTNFVNDKSLIADKFYRVVHKFSFSNMNITVNFEYQFMTLLDKIKVSIHEDQIIGDVETLIQNINDAKDQQQHQTKNSNNTDFNLNYYKWFNNIVIKLSLKQYLNALQLLSDAPLYLYDYSLQFRIYSVYEMAWENNLLEVVKWCLQRFKSIDLICNQTTIFINPFCKVCEFGYFEIAQVIFREFEKNSKHTENYLLIGFKNACKNNYANIVEWLLDLDIKTSKINYNMDIISYVCDHQYIEVIDILMRFKPYKLNIIFNEERTQVISYSVNSPEEEKWLQRKLPLLVHSFDNHNGINNNIRSFNSLPIEVVREICLFI